MKDEYIQDLMEGLYTSLKEASRAYYNGLDEVMDDAEYDDKINLLASLERQYPEYRKEDSPTVTVGYGGITGTLDKVIHPQKMLSLDKRYSMDEIISYFKDMLPIIGSYKADGLTVVMTYEDHVLRDAVTRGDGITGERIIKAARTFSNVPAWIPFSGKLIIRAEAVITEEQFQNINDQLDIPYKNARNLVSGTVRTLDSNVVAQRNVQAYVFEVIECEPTDNDRLPEAFFDSDYCQRNWVTEQGFECVNYELLNNEEDIMHYYDKVKEYRSHKESYGTDGIVFCVDDLQRKLALGVTAKYPLYALAFKFPNKGQVTTVREILWQAGMYSITPVVVTDPIEFDGVTVQKATAHNLAFVQGLNADGRPVKPPIMPGCQIKIERSGEVIPKIAEVFYEGTDIAAYSSVDFPHRCPVCGADTIQKGVDLICTNNHCTGKLKAKLRTMVSRGALNISGIGDKCIDMLIEKQYICTLTDLFSLRERREDLLKEDGYGIKKVDGILREIENAKNTPFPNVIAALCIKGVGVETGRVLVPFMPHGLIDLLNIDYSCLVKADGVGNVLADSILAFVSDMDNINLISTMIHCQIGSNVSMPDHVTSDALRGKTFCITGTLSSDRNSMEDFIRQHGGKPTGSVSKKTDFVIAGSNPGKSKMNKAEEYGITVITEDDLYSML